MRYQLEIPGCEPPSLNAWLGRHWRRRWEDKNAMEHWVAVFAATSDLPRPIVERVDIWVTAYNAPRLRDPDNLPVKAFIDGLRYAGVLAKDDATAVRWTGSRLVKDDCDARVIIEIEEIE